MATTVLNESGTTTGTGALHGVSWAAILAGAAGAAALSLILLVLGTGLGASSMSPWAQQGASSTTLGIGAILWLAITSLLASGLGGYLAGRLRSRWSGVHTDEVYFRDTAHGFLAWSVATLVTAAVLTSAIGGIVGTGVGAVGSIAGGGATAALSAGAVGAASSAGHGASSSNGADPGYFVDSLFRRDAAATPGAPADPASQGQAPVGEVGRIFAQSLKTGDLSKDDARYLGQLVATRTGLSQQDAEKRVNDTFGRAKAALADAETKARAAADAVRKASAYASLWLFISLLIGAFSASLAATFGGRQRDLY